MPSTLQQQLADFGAVLDRLDQALALQDSDVTRDSAILRFELAFELSWKCIQRAATGQGFSVNSPKQAFERAFALGWIADEVLWARILASRNLAIHTYREPLAIQLRTDLPGFLEAFRRLHQSLTQATPTQSAAPLSALRSPLSEEETQSNRETENT